MMAGLALALCFGCGVTSVYPFYTTRDVVFEPALVGTWVESNSTNPADEQWRFERIEGQAYKLTGIEKDKQTEFDTHLFKLKGQLFLDCRPRDRMDDAVPPHYLLKVTRLDPTLDMAMMNYDWLKNLIEKDPKAIRHIVVARKLGESGDAQVVLTADTAELQKFILNHEKTEGVFNDVTVLKRRKE